MTIYFPATDEELRRIVERAAETQAPPMFEASVDEFWRVCCVEAGAGASHS